MQAPGQSSLLSSIVGVDGISLQHFLQHSCQLNCELATDPLLEEADPQTRSPTGETATSSLKRVPRYALPNTSSVLPTYGNWEGEQIFRTFHTGNYDMLRLLPASLKDGQVAASRTARLEAARQLMLASIGTIHTAGPRKNQQGLFQPFEYSPSRFSLADELASTERVENEAKRLAVGGKEFVPPGAVKRGKHEGLADRREAFPYLSQPYEWLEMVLSAEKAMQTAQDLHGPFVPPSVQKLPLQPTRAVQRDTLAAIKRWLQGDWPGTELDVFVNEHDLWVARFDVAGVDSLEGLLTYMNVFVRCSQLASELGVTKVAHYWNIQPGDGNIYYTLRPTWAPTNAARAYYAVHPQEQTFKTSQAVTQAAAAVSAASRDNFAAVRAGSPPGSPRRKLMEMARGAEDGEGGLQQDSQHGMLVKLPTIVNAL